MHSGVIHKQLLSSQRKKSWHWTAQLPRCSGDGFFFFLNQSSYFKFFPAVFFVFYLEAGKVTFWALLISYLSQLTSFNNKQKSLRIQKHLYKACYFHLDSMSMLSPHTALIQATLPSRMEHDMLVFWLIRNLENCTVRMWLKRNGQYM